MMRQVFILTVSFSLLVIFVSACTQSPVPSIDSQNESADVTREEAITALRDADQAWSESTDTEGFLSFFAEDPIWLICDRPMMEGKEEIGAFVSDMHTRLKHKLDWKADRVDIGASGDMGYTAGNWQTSYENSDGQLVENSGSYLAIWKKQDDGKWKVAVEIDLPGQEMF